MKIMRLLIKGLFISSILILVSFGAFWFLPYEVELETDQVVIHHVIETKINLNEIIGLSERSGKRGCSYFIDTTHGSYDVGRKSFLGRNCKQIIDRLGLVERIANEGGARRLYCKPVFTSTNYPNYGRAMAGDMVLIGLGTGLLFVVLGLLLMISSLNVYVHTEEWGMVKMLESYRRSGKTPSTKFIKFAAVTQFVVGFCILLMSYLFFGDVLGT